MEMGRNQQDGLDRDELTLQQQQNIEKEISEANPLVSEKVCLSSLLNEYRDDSAFSNKIRNLSAKYEYIRRSRPDGNCFFRAFAYSYIEYLIMNPEEYQQFYELCRESKDRLLTLGFPKFTLEDFYQTFMEVLDRLRPDCTNKLNLMEELHIVFNDQGFSDYVVVYLRLLTSGQLKQDEEFFSDFIEDGMSVEEFRRQEVEPMYRESDHIHIIALCKAVQTCVRVEYLDRGEGSTAKTHDFPENDPPKVFLIYRPGHYDILYKK